MNNVYEKLQEVQKELKAPKNLYNSFGKYNYRSCESILESAKPLLNKLNVVLTLSDEVIAIGDRVYVKATAHFRDVETDTSITNTAWAREDEFKKGMDGSQITGTASSYARKYCLNGLFLIDDTKDADTDEMKNEAENRFEKTKKEKVGDNIVKSVRMTIEKNPNGMTEEGICKYFKIEKLEDMTMEQNAEFIRMVSEAAKKQKKEDKAS